MISVAFELNLCSRCIILLTETIKCLENSHWQVLSSSGNHHGLHAVAIYEIADHDAREAGTRAIREGLDQVASDVSDRSNICRTWFTVGVLDRCTSENMSHAVGRRSKVGFASEEFVQEITLLDRITRWLFESLVDNVSAVRLICVD